MTPKPTRSRTYITVQDAALEVACSPGTIRRLIEAGRLPAVDIGTGTKARWRIHRDDLLKIRRQREIARAG